MKAQKFEIKFLDEKYPAEYITDIGRAHEVLLELMLLDVIFGIDTETARLPKYAHIPDAALSPLTSNVRLLQVFDGERIFVFDLHTIADNALFVPFFKAKKFIAHNAIFEIQFFSKWFGVQNMDIGCTRIMARMVFHASRSSDAGLSASLDDLVLGLFKVDLSKDVQKSDWAVPDLTFEQIEYAALDPLAAIKIAEKFAPKLVKQGMKTYYNLCKKVQHPIAEMQLNGVLIDSERHREKVVEWRNDLYEAKKELMEMSGLEKITPHTMAGWLESHLPIDIMESWPRTDPDTGRGKLKTDANTLAEYQEIDIVAPFTRVQKKEKLTTSFGNRLIGMISPATGRIHAKYNICGARTGRLSCSEPNLQQAPSDADFRKSFIPSPGNVLVVADFSQIELRIVAEVSGEEGMQEAFRQGLDLYKHTASKLFNVKYEDVSDEQRKVAKVVMLGLQYGLGAKKLGRHSRKAGIHMTDEDGIDTVANYFEIYPALKQWMRETAKDAQAHLVTVSPLGKVRKLDEDNAYGAGLNNPIQSAAAEIMLLTLVFLWDMYSKGTLNYKLCNCVHDEIVIECDLATATHITKMVEDCMERAYLTLYPTGITRGICKVKILKNWGEMK